MTEPIEVPSVLAGERVDRALATLTGWTRAEVSRLCDAGDVLVAGRSVPKSRRLAEGELVEVLAEPVAPVPPGPERIPLDVRYADDDVIVLAKPAGLVVHPGAGHSGGTLVNGLLAEFPEIVDVGERDRPGIVHRLDRDTSGLLVVARTQVAYDALVEAMASRAIERHYDALAWGTFDSSAGAIDAPIGRSVGRRTRMAVREGGRAARTTYTVVEAWDRPEVSRLECRLETGRTHQIRVHLSAIGHPVVGDGAYRGARPAIPLDRPFLHAGALGFAHPVTGEPLRFEDALPDKLAAVLRWLDEEASQR